MIKLLLHEPLHDCSILATPTLRDSESYAILSDASAMRAVIDGSGKLPQATAWLKFYHKEDQFCGAMSILNVLTNPLQVEYHLFYLSSSPLKLVRIFCELTQIYAQLNRLQPYTVVRANLTYMVNFMRRMGAKEIPHHGRYFFYPDADWQPKYLTQVSVVY